MLATNTMVSKKKKMILPEQLDLEILNRELAHRELISFSTYMAPWYKPAPHHELVATYLEQVKLFVETEGAQGIGRLIILEPPRYGKSEQVSRLFPAWFLGNLPDKRVILTSYGADLAESDSEAVRNYVQNYRYSAVFGDFSTEIDPVKIDPDNSRRSKWDLADPYRGGMVAAGIGGGLTGFGAHLFLIDDPFKSRDDADSELYRGRVMSWYKSVAYQRLEKGGAMVITHTRWHPEDLVGELLKAMASNDPYADKWEVVFLPALALEENEYPETPEKFNENLLRGVFVPMGGDMLKRAPGQPLWPEKFNLESLLAKQANTDDVDWMSLDQQMPLSESGEMFSDENFGEVEKAPEGLQWFSYIDLALGKTELSDMNSTMPMAMDKEGNEYWRDLIHVRNLTEFFAQVKIAMLDPVNLGCVWGVESTGFQYVEFQKFLEDPELAGVVIIPIYPIKDKVLRARPLQSRGRAGKIKLVKAPWNKVLKRQFATFPRGKHDDLVDVASGGNEMIAKGFSRKKKKARSYQG